jgi:DNA invertase Pin-like site-specific DNA recombinase
MRPKFCIYTRVSTKDQGKSGLGLDDQIEMCTKYVQSQNGEILEHFTDVLSGRNRKRRELLAAIELCKEQDATLVISKLDRLARDAEFIFRIYNTGIKIYVLDLPLVNTMLIGIFAVVAQYEAELISARTKSSLRVAKKRGIKLGSHNEKWKEGNPETIMAWQSAGAAASKMSGKMNENNIRAAKFIVQSYGRCNGSWTKIAGELNNYGFKTSKGKLFQAKTVQRIYERREDYV